jgi:hypothetical protein
MGLNEGKGEKLESFLRSLDILLELFEDLTDTLLSSIGSIPETLVRLSNNLRGKIYINFVEAYKTKASTKAPRC